MVEKYHFDGAEDCEFVRIEDYQDLESELARLRRESAEAWLTYHDEQSPYEPLVIKRERWEAFRMWCAARAAKEPPR